MPYFDLILVLMQGTARLLVIATVATGTVKLVARALFYVANGDWATVNFVHWSLHSLPSPLVTLYIHTLINWGI